jgi:hypothetical protein
MARIDRVLWSGQREVGMWSAGLQSRLVDNRRENILKALASLGSTTYRSKSTAERTMLMGVVVHDGICNVSLADEEPELTTRHEVAEELGLSRAMMDLSAALSDPILTCVVCTAYNHCVITLFS